MADAKFPLVQFSSSSPVSAALKTFMRGDLCALYTEKCQKIHQNRLAHLCIAVVNRLG